MEEEMDFPKHKSSGNGTVGYRVVQYKEGIGVKQDDILALEEPLEIRVAGETVAITMRTPGADRALALGFLYGEGIIQGIGDIGRAGHCGRPGDLSYGNVIDVLPAPGSSLDPEKLRSSRRGTLISSACGVCGREKVEDLVQRCRPIESVDAIDPRFVFDIQNQMHQGQMIFAETGGVHAAAAFSRSGGVLSCFEDIGRHNAVDKVVGDLLEQGHHSSNSIGANALVVSSRASFEIVQKAAVARIPVVVAVSAASSLAVQLAEAMGIALVGFARENRMVVYTGNISG